jgi:peptidoglycan/LPS O-acetylase OafA/YrhL
VTTAHRHELTPEAGAGAGGNRLSIRTTRIGSLDALRGLAAVAVCYFHFTFAHSDFLPAGAFKESGSYGRYGVQVFFVISGFVIPYALWRNGYRIADYGRFLLKRVIRLDPPYLACIAFVLATGYVATKFSLSRSELVVSLPQVAAHLAYLNVFLDYPWLVPVFWTLAIEFQYYLLIGVAFPLISSPDGRIRNTALAALAAFAFLPVDGEQWVSHWLFVFVSGIAVFNYRVGHIGRRELGVILALAGAGAGWVNGPTVAFVAAGCAIIIANWDFVPARPLLFLGRISYGLYLLHVPIGVRILNFSLRSALSLPEKVAIIAVAFTASVLAAWGLHRWVESPAQRWSAMLSYRRE